jgi:hypothetical protein
VIEAAPESLELKRSLFERLSRDINSRDVLPPLAEVRKRPGVRLVIFRSKTIWTLSGRPRSS